jgi:hypothetical protein
MRGGGFGIVEIALFYRFSTMARALQLGRARYEASLTFSISESTMSTMFKTAMFAGLIGLSLVACGKKDEGATGSASTTSAAPKTGSCQKLGSAGKCTEYPIKEDLVATIQKGGCEATEGKWEMTACPADKQFANCATSESKIIYYAGTQAAGSALTMDEEFAKIDCEMMSGKLTVTAKPAAPAASAAAAAAAPAAPAKKAGPAPAAPAAAPKPKK